jgi:hypothetical protein
MYNCELYLKCRATEKYIRASRDDPNNIIQIKDNIKCYKNKRERETVRYTHPQQDCNAVFKLDQQKKEKIYQERKVTRY